MVVMWIGVFGGLLYCFLELCVYKREVIIFFKHRLWSIDPTTLEPELIDSVVVHTIALRLDEDTIIALTGEAQEARFFRKSGDYWYPVTYPVSAPFRFSPANIVMSTVNKRFNPILEDLNTMKEL